MITKRPLQVCTGSLAVILILGVCHYGLSADAVVPRVPATDSAALREQVGRKVTVSGHIERTGQSRSGYQFLNFGDSEFTAVCHPQHVAGFREGKPADVYRNKDVELTGEIEIYEGKLQIRLRTPSQIRIVPAARPDRTKAFALKEVGKDAWLSPAGLRYRGRDPEGLTRVAHIGRHTSDIPERDGPHGVFDGDLETALAVIDEAWQLAQKRGLRPQREGDRSSFTVNMGRRIGFLGGRTGAARQNPPLRQVFIVFTSGTQDIITAFPK